MLPDGLMTRCGKYSNTSAGVRRSRFFTLSRLEAAVLYFCHASASSPADMETTMNQARGRWVTAAEAVQASARAIQSRGHACGEPRTVLEALPIAPARCVEFDGSHTRPGAPLLPATGNRRQHPSCSLFCSTGTRIAVNEGWADFMPCFFNQVRRSSARTSLLTSPWSASHRRMRDGYCSLGVSVDYSLRLLRSAGPSLPKSIPPCPALRRLHGARLRHRLPGRGRPAHPEVPPSPPTDEERRTGENAAELNRRWRDPADRHWCDARGGV